jgi:hypothetical protein
MLSESHVEREVVDGVQPDFVTGVVSRELNCSLNSRKYNHYIIHLRHCNT